MADQEPPQRVRVTGPPRDRVGKRTRLTADLDEDTPIGRVMVTSLIREQARAAAMTLTAVAVVVGTAPLLFWLRPDWAEEQVWGIPIAFLLLGVAVYPLLVFLGWRYVRRAERNERSFIAMIDEDGP